MKRLACALLLAGSVGLVAGSEAVAAATPSRSAAQLQLSILTPDPNAIGERLSVDVSFRGSIVQSVELYLDGRLVTRRQLSVGQTRGVISFSLETAHLSEGPHDVLVKAYGPDGKPITASGKLRIPPADLNAAVRIANPPNGIEVSGVVPIRVFLDPAVQREKPYVTFFINKEFKVLRNFPPYEYQWDTTRYPNGWHVLEVLTQSADAVAPTRARPIHVNVNNSGGETKKQTAIRDLRKELGLPPDQPVKLEEPAAAVSADSATIGAAQTTVPTIVVGEEATPPSLAPRPRAGTDTPRADEPGVLGLGITSRPAPAAISPVQNRQIGSVGARPRMMGPAATQPKDRLVIASAPRTTLPGLSLPESGLPVIPKAMRPETSVIKVQPGDTLRILSKKTGASAAEIARLNNLDKNQKLPIRRSIIVPKSGAFEIAFNGTRIAFDVQPRVENGVRLAPFRQIFEHSGGKLYWYGTEKTVRAVNSTREIEIRVGDRTATVNNTPVTMERTPYIISGRTIVPLSFIKDAMDVRISFDENTGRLLIESSR